MGMDCVEGLGLVMMKEPDRGFTHRSSIFERAEVEYFAKRPRETAISMAEIVSLVGGLMRRGCLNVLTVVMGKAADAAIGHDYFVPDAGAASLVPGVNAD
jgi:hypothetical protein